jgi:hypothetical protein
MQIFSNDSGVRILATLSGPARLIYLQTLVLTSVHLLGLWPYQNLTLTFNGVKC